MKKLISLFLLVSNFIFAQTTVTEFDDSYLGKISLSVLVNDNPDGMTQSQIMKLQSKALAVATNNGVGGVSHAANFILAPTIMIYDTEVAELTRNITVVSAELNLRIKQSSNGLVFSAYSVKIKGSGSNKEDALNNVISQINPNDPEVKQFVEEGKRKIIQFYNSKCSDIILEAEKYSSINEYERALAILANIPVEATPCYEKIKDKSIQIFKLYKNKQCQSLIQLAKSQIAGNKFLAGLNTLAVVDPTSSCFNEAKVLQKTTESKIDEVEKKEWDFKKEQAKNQLELQKVQIAAIRDVTVAYFNKKPSMVDSILGFLF